MTKQFADNNPEASKVGYLVECVLPDDQGTFDPLVEVFRAGQVIFRKNPLYGNRRVVEVAEWAQVEYILTRNTADRQMYRLPADLVTQQERRNIAEVVDALLEPYRALLAALTEDRGAQFKRQHAKTLDALFPPPESVPAKDEEPAESTPEPAVEDVATSEEDPTSGIHEDLARLPGKRGRKPGSKAKAKRK